MRQLVQLLTKQEMREYAYERHNTGIQFLFQGIIVASHYQFHIFPHRTFHSIKVTTQFQNAYYNYANRKGLYHQPSFPFLIMHAPLHKKYIYLIGPNLL